MGMVEHIFSEENSQREKEANIFAVTLLMPEYETCTNWHIYHNLAYLAACFGVPVPVAKFRLKQLGLISVNENGTWEDK
jgi:Zn-dependent peptidase ImmA (M78 family)